MVFRVGPSVLSQAHIEGDVGAGCRVYVEGPDGKLVSNQMMEALVGKREEALEMGAELCSHEVDD